MPFQIISRLYLQKKILTYIYRSNNIVLKVNNYIYIHMFNFILKLCPFLEI